MIKQNLQHCIIIIKNVWLWQQNRKKIWKTFVYKVLIKNIPIYILSKLKKKKEKQLNCFKTLRKNPDNNVNVNYLPSC